MRLRSEFERLREALLLELTTQRRRGDRSQPTALRRLTGAGRARAWRRPELDQMLHPPQIGLSRPRAVSTHTSVTSINSS
jgi:hypothetical protein